MYVITSGTSIVNEFLEDQKGISFTATNRSNNGIHFDTIGEAMKVTSKINKLINSPIYKVIFIDKNGN